MCVRARDTRVCRFEEQKERKERKSTASDIRQKPLVILAVNSIFSMF